MTEENKFQKYGVVDGNTAASQVAYALSDMIFIYPITPATSMGEKADEYSAQGKKNIFGDVVKITQMQSEGGVSGALHGAINSGSLCSTFTCSQGLLLMIPEMLKIAGELQPCVIHVASRAVGGQAMNICCDFGDVYATKHTGWALFASGSVQEASDLATLAHFATQKSFVPFLHFFDGFRVSHEIQKVLVPTNDLYKELFDSEVVLKWRERKTMRNNNPTMRGLVQDADFFFPLQEASNIVYESVPRIVQDLMDKFHVLTGRKYSLFQYYGDPEAKYVVVTMGATTKSFEEYIDHHATLEISKSRKYGLISVHLFHPFSVDDFVKAIPTTCKHLTILDRAKEPGAVGEALYLECLAALQQSGRLFTTNPDGSFAPLFVYSGRHCLGGYDVSPSIVHAVFENMKDLEGGRFPQISSESKIHFTVGVTDDVTNLSLTLPSPPVVIDHKGVTQALFYGFGADGTVGSVKNAMDIIGDNTDLYSQAFFVYDAKKSGGVTISHVRFGSEPIVQPYEIYNADYLACHHPSYVNKYEMLQRIKPHGVFVLNCPYSDVSQLDPYLPGQTKRAIVEKELQFYVIDAEKIATSVGLRGRINMVMQTIFFYLSNVLPMEKAISLLKGVAEKTFRKKGEEVVKQNHQCIDQSITNLIHISPSKDWRESVSRIIPVFSEESKSNKYFTNIAVPVLGLRGNVELKVSDMLPYVGGVLPTSTSQFEKRNVSALVPKWESEKCVQCNLCAFLCPHSAIRPFLVTDNEFNSIKNESACEAATYQFPRAATKGKIPTTGKSAPDELLSFVISISTSDCVGCGLCVNDCPVKALSLVENNNKNEDYVKREQQYYNRLLKIPMEERSRLLWDPADDWSQARKKSEEEKRLVTTPAPTLKAIAFTPPLLEYNASCGGCAESPLVKVLTQMFGERMVVAVSCGCSMVWGGYSPCCPYTVNSEGIGPAYTGSLFEDTAEFALGIASGGELVRSQLKRFVEKLVARLKESDVSQEELISLLGVSETREGEVETRRNLLIKLAEDWIGASYEDPYASKKAGLYLQALFSGRSVDFNSPLPSISLPSLTLSVSFSHPLIREIWGRRDLFQKKSYWCIGGDGWAYDIGFGGLDHVLQMGQKLNIIVLDTEVYSNTGGQKSKATPRGAVAKFSAGGKETKKKDLAGYAIGLGGVYVATVAQGANTQQFIRSLHEAEQYPGTSLVIALCPCINWSLKKGLGSAVEEEKLAVKTGYWPLYRFNPLAEYTVEVSDETGGTKTVTRSGVLTLDSPAPSLPVKKLLENENRFASLLQTSPEKGQRLQDELQQDINQQYSRLVELANQTNPKKKK